MYYDNNENKNYRIGDMTSSYSEDISVDGIILLKFILRKCDVMEWTRFLWVWTGSICEHGVEFLVSINDEEFLDQVCFRRVVVCGAICDTLVHCKDFIKHSDEQCIAVSSGNGRGDTQKGK